MSKNVSLRASLSKNQAPAAAPATTPTTPDPTTPFETPYAELIRKETRLRPEQLTQIDTLRRRLNAARLAAEKELPREQRTPSVQDHVITRAAITFLLENADAIDGSTEQGILQSLRKLKG